MLTKVVKIKTIIDDKQSETEYPAKCLYLDFLDLCKNNEGFYYSTQQYKNYDIVSFSYRLASYTDFKAPLGLECRGITFCVEKTTEENIEYSNVNLFARPMEKFFNYGENLCTSEETISKLKSVRCTDKLDGSMVMVGMLPNGEILAKTKTSINSDQAKRANDIIYNDINLKYFCEYYILKGYTPIFEYTAPTNCIVIRYAEEKLTLIALRHMITGEYLDIHDLPTFSPKTNVVEEYKTTLEEITKLQKDINQKNEGWVVLFDNSQRVKFKTLDYVRKHRCKDSINNIKHLADLIINGGLDDVIPLFEGDKATLDYIYFHDEIIKYLYNTLENKINEFYNENKELPRKEYAIKAREYLEQDMGLAMNLYLNRDLGLKEYFIKNELYKNEI